MNKKLVYFILIVFLIVAGIWYINNSNTTPKEIEDVADLNQEAPISMCFYYSQKTDKNFYDVSWLRLDILGEKISGEFNNYPAEKDSKIGKFEGIVGKVDQLTMGRIANVWWDVFAEGMNSKEELMIEFGDGSASAFFGEMADRGDGVYVYKDKTELFFGPSLSQIDCISLEEKIIVEKYIRENIKNIATNNAVLGGNWYVLSVFVIPSLNSGEILYEDGHIQSTANFEYDFNEQNNSVTIKNFKVLE